MCCVGGPPGGSCSLRPGARIHSGLRRFTPQMPPASLRRNCRSTSNERDPSCRNLSHPVGIQHERWVPRCLVSALTSGAALAVPGVSPSVIAMNQKLKGDAVSITYAYVPKDGTLAIFSSDGSGKMSAKPIGHVALSAGDHRDIKVTLSSDPKPGTKTLGSAREVGFKLGTVQGCWRAGRTKLQSAVAFIS